jgi:hypothetical protein
MTSSTDSGLEQASRHLSVMLECYRAEPTEEGRQRQRRHVNMGVRMVERWLADWIKENRKCNG